eukprot:364001-Chlamydomonas_euryale.AAC.11
MGRGGGKGGGHAEWASGKERDPTEECRKEVWNCGSRCRHSSAHIAPVAQDEKRGVGAREVTRVGVREVTQVGVREVTQERRAQRKCG